MLQLDDFMITETASGKTATLSFDEDGHLYINGQKVVTEQKVKLEMWVNVAIVLGALGGFAQGLVAVLGLFK